MAVGSEDKTHIPVEQRQGTVMHEVSGRVDILINIHGIVIVPEDEATQRLEVNIVLEAEGDRRTQSHVEIVLVRNGLVVIDMTVSIDVERVAIDELDRSNRAINREQDLALGEEGAARLIYIVVKSEGLSVIESENYGVDAIGSHSEIMTEGEGDDLAGSVDEVAVNYVEVEFIG